jgi:hypothetical protein
MIRYNRLEHRFVQHLPEVLEAGVVYVSVEFATAAHKCCCGCGEEVVTPLSPNDWKLTFDGDSISLSPSIGNWNFTCRSHYWIERNTAIEAFPTRKRGGHRIDAEGKANNGNAGIWARIKQKMGKRKNTPKKPRNDIQ